MSLAKMHPAYCSDGLLVYTNLSKSGLQRNADNVCRMTMRMVYTQHVMGEIDYGL